MDWINRGCKDCIFNINDVCRRFPVETYKFADKVKGIYPPVDFYTAACAEFKENG